MLLMVSIRPPFLKSRLEILQLVPESQAVGPMHILTHFYTFFVTDCENLQVIRGIGVHSIEETTACGRPLPLAIINRSVSTVLLATHGIFGIELLLFDRMTMLLDLWYVNLGCGKPYVIINTGRTALILEIPYLAFQAFPVIFMKGHGLDMQSTGMSFLGIGLGMGRGISTQPSQVEVMSARTWVGLRVADL